MSSWRKPLPSDGNGKSSRPIDTCVVDSEGFQTQFLTPPVTRCIIEKMRIGSVAIDAAFTSTTPGENMTRYSLLAAFIALCCAFGPSASAQTSIMEQQDARVIELLRNAGTNLSKPHDIDFFLTFHREADASTAAVELKAAEYNIERIARSPDGKQWEVHAKRKMVPELAAMQASTRRLQALAAAHNGEYDGWGTGAVK